MYCTSVFVYSMLQCEAKYDVYMDAAICKLILLQLSSSDGEDINVRNLSKNCEYRSNLPVTRGNKCLEIFGQLQIPHPKFES